MGRTSRYNLDRSRYERGGWDAALCISAIAGIDEVHHGQAATKQFKGWTENDSSETFLALRVTESYPTNQSLGLLFSLALHPRHTHPRDVEIKAKTRRDAFWPTVISFLSLEQPGLRNRRCGDLHQRWPVRTLKRSVQGTYGSAYDVGSPLCHPVVPVAQGKLFERPRASVTKIRPDSPASVGRMTVL